jgi:hypothetical protein
VVKLPFVIILPFQRTGWYSGNAPDSSIYGRYSVRFSAELPTTLTGYSWLSSHSQRDYYVRNLKHNRTASFQILNYGPFMIIPQCHLTFQNLCNWTIDISHFHATNEIIS